MRVIDFLSDSPNNYIFQKKTYKTNFGGILFLIFAIIMITIAASYIVDYALNDKYEIEYLKIINQTNPEDLDGMQKDPNFNPTIKFKMSVTNPTNEISKKFMFFYYEGDGYYTGKKGKYIYHHDTNTTSLDYYINSSVSNLNLYLTYYCGNDPNCGIDETKNQLISFEFEVPVAWIHHDSPNPFQKQGTKTYKYNTTFTKYKYNVYEWTVIKYKEKKGISRIFDKILNLKTEYYAGDISEYGLYETSNLLYWPDGQGNYYKVLVELQMENYHWVYDEYRRRKISPLDVLSKISALFFPIRIIFLFIYKFYFSNFENYKIIELILNKTNKNNKSYKKINIKNDIQLNDNLKKLEDDKARKNIEINDPKISYPLIDYDPDDNKFINNTSINDDDMNNYDSNFETKENKKKRILPKFSFIQFFLNNCYCTKCCNKCNFKSKQQQILNLCNTTIMKYLSVDSILYNQMIFENLIKDQNWNNKSLNNIENNEYIINLKALI